MAKQKLALWFPGDRDVEYYGFGRVRGRLIDALRRAGFFVLEGGVEAPPHCIQISWTQPFDFKHCHDIWDRKPGVKYSIGYTVFESSVMPKGWPESFRQHDFAWTPSTFCDNVLKRELDLKHIDISTSVIQHGVDPNFFPMDRDLYRGENGDPFTFLWVGMNPQDRKRGFFVHKVFERIKTKDMKLILKYVPYGNARHRFLNVNQISYLCEYISDEDLKAMLYNSDCFVYPTRCEGYGLQPLEFTATGLPCIATAYSGQLDYIFSAKEVWDRMPFNVSEETMNQYKDRDGNLNGLMMPLNDFALAESFYNFEAKAKRDVGDRVFNSTLLDPEWNYGVDAEVSEDDLAEKMLFAYHHQDETKQIASMMARFVHANFKWDHAALAVQKAFESYGILDEIAWNHPTDWMSFCYGLNVGDDATGVNITQNKPLAKGIPIEFEDRIAEPGEVLD